MTANMTVPDAVPTVPTPPGTPLLAPPVRPHPDAGKIFVGGLSRETTTSGLQEYFERFGEISDCVVMKDRTTGLPRGFGFVTYASHTVADRVVLNRHIIDGKEVEAKPAVPREPESAAAAAEAAARPQCPGPPDIMQGLYAASARGPGPAMGGACYGMPMGGGGACPGTGGPRPPGQAARMNSNNSNKELEARRKKVFVGGLAHETTEADFSCYFGQFGAVADCVIMCDPHTRRPRGFGFVTYENLDSVERVAANPIHELSGKRVEVKRAVPPGRTQGAAPDGGGHYGPAHHAAHHTAHHAAHHTAHHAAHHTAHQCAGGYGDGGQYGEGGAYGGPGVRQPWHGMGGGMGESMAGGMGGMARGMGMGGMAGGMGMGGMAGGMGGGMGGMVPPPGQRPRRMGSMHPNMHPSMRLGPSHPAGPALPGGLQGGLPGGLQGGPRQPGAHDSLAGDDPGPADSSDALNAALSSANAVLRQASLADPPSSVPSSAAPTAGGGEDTQALAAMGGGLCSAFSSGSNNYSSATASLSAGRANYSSYDGQYNEYNGQPYDGQLQQGQFPSRGSSMAAVAPVGSSMAFAQMAAAASKVANDGHSSMAYAQAALMAAGGTASISREAACWQAAPPPQPPPLPPHDQL